MPGCDGSDAPKGQAVQPTREQGPQESRGPPLSPPELGPAGAPAAGFRTPEMLLQV